MNGRIAIVEKQTKWNAFASSSQNLLNFVIRCQRVLKLVGAINITAVSIKELPT